MEERERAVMEDKIQRGKKWLETVLALMGVPASVNVSRIEEGENGTVSCWLTIDQTNLSPTVIDALIGKKGENIDSLQYLINVLLNLNLPENEQCTYIIELNGYRLRRQAELMAIAQRAAEKVRLTGMPEEIRHLSSVERRQVHNFLAKAGDLATESYGSEPDRRLIVKLRR